MSVIKRCNFRPIIWRRLQRFFIFKLLLLQFAYAPAKKMRDCKGNIPFCTGFPIGARSIPVGTRFCFAKSSVLYLCFRLTRERGWRRTLRCGRVWQQTLFRGSRTGGFCDGGLRHKRRIFEKQNPTGRKRRQRYIKPPSRRSAAFVSVFLPLPFAMGHGRFPALAAGAFQVFGQLQHLDQVDKLFHCDGIVIDP